MSSLLEHLLEGDELLAKRGDDDANPTPNTKPVEPENKPLTAPQAKPPEPEPQLTPTSAQDTEVEDARAGEDAIFEHETTAEETCSSASAALPGMSDTCPSIPRASPVILVGFGTGANALLHLAAGPLSQERSDDVGVDSGGDGERALRDGVDGEFNETEGDSDAGNGVEAGGGLLRSILCRKGFRVGGLVLVNGFVSLDEQSTQARGIWRTMRCLSIGALSELGRRGGR